MKSVNGIGIEPSFDPGTVLFNGTLITADRQFSVPSAIAIQGTRIIAVGNDDAILRLSQHETKRIDLQGRCVLPGLVDGYAHFIYSGVDLLGDRGKVNIISLQSIDEILSAIKRRTDVTPEGEWIGTSCMYRGALKEGRFPTREDLDHVAPKHPVYILQGGRPIIANTLALQLAGIDRDTPNPTDPAGTIVRDTDGEPTGQLIAGAADLARKRWAQRIDGRPEHWDLALFDRKTLVEAIEAQQRVFHACGVTAIRDEGTTRREVGALIEAHSSGVLTTRTGMLLSIPERYLSDSERNDLINSYFEPWDLGDDMLWVEGVSLVYSLEGWFMIDAGGLRFLISEGIRRGWRLAITPGTGGDRETVDTVLLAFEHSRDVDDIPRRRCSLLHPMALREPQDIARAKALGLSLNPNPLLAYYAAARSLRMHAVVAQSGLHQGIESDPFAQTARMWGNPIRTWLDAGLVVTAGSNSPAAVYDIDHPFLGLYSAMTGDTLAGVLLKNQTLSLEQAIRLQTSSAAYALGREQSFGSLEPGKFADFVVADRDLTSCSATELRDARVLQTYVGGSLVYER